MPFLNRPWPMWSGTQPTLAFCAAIVPFTFCTDTNHDVAAQLRRGVSQRQQCG